MKKKKKSKFSLIEALDGFEGNSFKCVKEREGVDININVSDFKEVILFAFFSVQSDVF